MSAGAIVFTTAIVCSFSTGCSQVNGIKHGQVRMIASDVNRLEGIEWHLMEVSGSPVSPLRGERQPFIIFDGTKKQVNGFNGCNNFFSDYKIDDSSMNFAPVGATRMFCEGTAGEVEMKFMQALGKTRSWEIRDSLLILLDNGDVLARFTTVGEDVPEVDLDSMTFLSKWLPLGKVTLSHGEHRETVVPGSTSEIVVKLTDKRAFGMVNGRETGAVVLVTTSGGSGTFHDLQLLTKDAEGWVNTDTVFLGDRVKIRTVKIKSDQIVIVMRTHGPNDPMCCPTLEVVNKFTVKKNKLVPVADVPSTKNIPEIGSSDWKLATR